GVIAGPASGGAAIRTGLLTLLILPLAGCNPRPAPPYRGGRSGTTSPRGGAGSAGEGGRPLPRAPGALYDPRHRPLPPEALMGKKLYVGNLSYETTNADLEAMFAAHGSVQSAQVITDRETGRSKGFGFVEMGSDQEAQAAIAALGGKQVGGRSLTVNEAK